MWAEMLYATSWKALSWKLMREAYSAFPPVHGLQWKGLADGGQLKWWHLAWGKLESYWPWSRSTSLLLCSCYKLTLPTLAHGKHQPLHQGAVATVKIPLANVRKINILFDNREPKQKIKTSSRPHMVTRPGATYKKFEDGWPSHLADRHYWLAIFLLQLTNSSNGMTPSINLFFLTDK